MSHDLSGHVNQIRENIVSFQKNRPFLLLMCVFFIALIFGTVLATDTSHERGGVEVTLESLTEEMARKEELLNALNGSVADLAVLQARLTSEIATIKAAAESDITTHRATLMGKVDAAVAEKRLEISALEGKLAAYKAQLAELRDFDATEKAALAKLAALQQKLIAVGITREGPGAAFGNSWAYEKQNLALSVLPAAQQACYLAWKTKENRGISRTCLPLSSLDSTYANAMAGERLLLISPLFKTHAQIGVDGYYEIVDFNTGVVLVHSIYTSQLNVTRFSELLPATRETYEEMRRAALEKASTTK